MLDAGTKENIKERINLYSEAYSTVLSDSMKDNTPFNKMTSKLDEYFEKYSIEDEKRLMVLTQTLSQMTQGVTTTSQEIALRIILESERLEAELKKLEKEKELIGAQAQLAKAEKNLTEKRIGLVTEQIALEKAKKPLIDREVAAHDDNLRIEQAKAAKDLLGSYSLGEVDPPTGFHTTVLDLINKITSGKKP